jgi:hypothetical protein
MFNILLAQTNPFGQVAPPPGVSKYGTGTVGLVKFISNGVKLLIVVAAIYTLLNLIFAGYQFISAGGDSKAVEQAWGKIWQSLLGLFLVAGSFVLAAVFGQLIFGDPGFILNPDFTKITP